MKALKLFTLALLVIFGALLISPPAALAQDAPAKVCGTLPEAFCQQVVTATADQANPLGGLKPIVDSIANILIGVYGVFAVLVLVVSGVQISASAGNENAVKSARDNVLKVVTGLVLLLSSRAIIEIINNVFKSVNTSANLFEASGNSLRLAQGGIPTILGNIISIASFLSGIVAVIFIIVGGIRLITSAGSSKAIEGARKTITYAVVGLVLSISAYGILVFIQSQLTR
jgi:hypothetical protein